VSVRNEIKDLLAKGCQQGCRQGLLKPVEAGLGGRQDATARPLSANPHHLNPGFAEYFSEAAPRPDRNPTRTRGSPPREKRVQHGDYRSLDDLVFESGNRQRTLSAIRLRDVRPPAGQRPVCSSVSACNGSVRLSPGPRLAQAGR
jgi:hypothetical protein